MISLFHSYFTLRVKICRYIGKKYSPAKGVGRVYRREGSNPSFSAKKPENAEFSGFFDALNLLLLQTPKKESGEKLDKMACYFTRYFTRPFLLLHSYFTFWGLLSISIHQIPGHKFPLFFYHFVCSFLLFIAHFIIMIINIE